MKLIFILTLYFRSTLIAVLNDEVRGLEDYSEAARSKSSKIVIVGAGIAGLAAAEKLINTYNFNDVTIYEALDRVGGRIYTIPFGNSAINIGAEWVHGKNNEIYKLAQSLGALASQNERQRKITGEDQLYFTESGCQLTRSQASKLEDMKDKLEELVDEQADYRRNRYRTSIGQLYEKNYQNYLATNPATVDLSRSYRDAMFSFIKKSVEAEYGVSDWNKLAARSSWDYADTVGNSDYELGPMGYKPIVDWFVNRIPYGKIQFRKKVQKITYQNNAKVKVDLDNGETIYADHVIVTSSLGYLKQHALQMFYPQLPDKLLNTINGLGFDAVDKLFLVYDRPYPFWGANNESINFLNVQNNDRWCGTNTNNIPQLSKIIWGFETKPFFDNVLMAFISGGDVDIMESASDQELAQSATAALRRYMNKPDIPNPQLIFRSNWKKNPMFLGSYSYYSIACDQTTNCETKSLQTPVSVIRNGVKVPVIFFAGEATSEHEFQTAHGALSSGVRVATEINNLRV